MTPTEAVTFLANAAWQRHFVTCPMNLEVEKPCNCGAAGHNAKVREALLVIGKAKKKP